MRINKYLAQQGTATRREADTLIEQGLVFVNGKRATLGQKVLAGDTVELRQKHAKKHEYYLYYKPRGIITHSPSADETDVVTKVARDHGITNVFPIGRLDKDSEGLLILTNDGRITGPLLNPESTHEKEYEVTVDKRVTGMFLQKLEHGVNIEGYVTKRARALKHPKKVDAFNLILTEGKKHQIRRMCAALGYQVQSLKRIRIMEYQLGNTKPNSIQKLTEEEARRLQRTLGIQT